jgi:hypothetical protein
MRIIKAGPGERISMFLERLWDEFENTQENLMGEHNMRTIILIHEDLSYELFRMSICKRWRLYR